MILSSNKTNSVPTKNEYNELMIKFNHLKNDYNHLEQNILIKTNTINDQIQIINNYETILENLKLQIKEDSVNYTKSIHSYKLIIEDYKKKLNKLNHELSHYKNLEFKSLEDNLTATNDTDEDLLHYKQNYEKLLKEFKILKSNFDLEQNNKILLINQIEFLTKQKEESEDFGIEEGSESESEEEVNEVEDKDKGYGNFIDNYDDITYNYTSYVNTDEAEDEHIQSVSETLHSDMEAGTNEELIEEQPDQMNDQGLEELPQSSPIKSRIPSLISTQNFQFPPSPDPNSKKRQSLPLNLDNDFILSPLKLSERKRHSRYNSDLKIKVEFEKLPNLNNPNNLSNSTLPNESTSEHLGAGFESPLETRNFSNDFNQEALDKLNNNSYTSSNNSRSYRNSGSYRHSGSYRNSGLPNLKELNELNEFNEEITKLKFELQSLKLHNEKLLSFISFELQKHNKKIKKLSSRNFEYNDNKLISKSKRLLANKKILRSVSINSIWNDSIKKDLKKFKSMNFKFINDINKSIDFEDLSFDNDFENDSDFEVDEFHNNSDFCVDDIDELDDLEELEETDDEEIGIFGQLKHLIMGKPKNDITVDDSLKYQFLTIAIGILIIGIRFGHHEKV